MNVTHRHRDLLSSKGPWVRFLVCTENEVDDIAMNANRRTAGLVWIVRGQRCGTKSELLREWGAALQFPSYFGENWDAFEDCVNDLDWLPGKSRTIIVTNTHRILQSSRSEWRTFIDVLRSSCEGSTPRRSNHHWHYVFHTDFANEKTTLDRLHDAGVDLADL
jgi:hypothetical protein